jgi:hypothetical protein
MDEETINSKTSRTNSVSKDNLSQGQTTLL